MAYTTIDDPTAHFQVELWSGTGSSNARTFDSDTDMQPDMVWIKCRSDTEYHRVYDAVRGVHKELYTNTTGAEATNTNALTAFGSDGFTVGSETGVNNSGQTFVAWCWKAGTTSGITAGDITPDGYSINTTSKFAIIKYPGNSTDDSDLNHGLGVAPTFIIIKVLTNADQDWMVYHEKNTSAPETDYLYWNSTGATVDRVESWSDEKPNSTAVVLGSSGDANTNGTERYIGYIWGEVQGFSKFGAYEGNGNADGTFIYTGFRPALVFTKEIDATSSWMVFDNKRSGYNGATLTLRFNDSGGDGNSNLIDILSNGFKIKSTSSEVGTSGSTYIYGAFAEAPRVKSNGVPCNAR